MKPKVFVQVLNYNGEDLLRQTLPLLLAQDYSNLHIQILDNGSTDGSIAFVKSLSAQISLIENGTNLGLAKARNIGFEYALGHKADFVLTLDNDTFLWDKGLISSLMECIEKHNLSSFFSLGVSLAEGAEFNKVSKGVNLFGKSFNTSKKSFSILFQNDTINLVDFVPGCFMLINMGNLKKTGLLQESFYIYFEEADLSLRSWEMGFPTGIIPDLRAGHNKTITNVKWSPFFSYYFLRNYMVVAHRHAGLSACRLSLCLNVVKKCISYTAISLTHGLHNGSFFRNLKAVVFAFYDFLFAKEFPIRYKL